MVNITQIQKVDFEGIEQKLVMPQVISNTYFNKLYINSMEVHYKDNKMIFFNKTMNDYRNYNPIKDKTLNCYFNKKEQTLKLNESIITNVININTWMMFPVLNIPTLMFILTSFITNNTLTIQKDKDLER